MSNDIFQRGDIILVSLPFISDPAQSKIRPAVIIQNNTGNRYSPNLIIASISSQLPSREYPTNVILRVGSSETEGSGLDRDSVIQTEIILTIPKANIVRKLGKISEKGMGRVNQAVKVSLALP
jgi:mRNA interferase MazF